MPDHHGDSDFRPSLLDLPTDPISHMALSLDLSHLSMFRCTCTTARDNKDIQKQQQQQLIQTISDALAVSTATYDANTGFINDNGNQIATYDLKTQKLTLNNVNKEEHFQAIKKLLTNQALKELHIPCGSLAIPLNKPFTSMTTACMQMFSICSSYLPKLHIEETKETLWCKALLPTVHNKGLNKRPDSSLQITYMGPNDFLFSEKRFIQSHNNGQPHPKIAKEIIINSSHQTSPSPK